VAGDLYNRVKDSDHGANRLLMLAGQWQLGATPGAGDKGPLFAGGDITSVDIEGAGVSNLVNAATSTYRPAGPIMEIAVDRPAIFQRFHHAGAEAYSSRTSFLLTAGGVKAPPANKTYGVGRDADRGVAMPTTLMPTDGGLSIKDLIRFEGVGTGA